MIRSMENQQHAGGDVNDDLEKAIAISLGNDPKGFKPYQTNDIKKSSKYKSNLYTGIEDISEEEQIKRLLELSKEESEKVQTLADQISEEEQMKKILEISRRESEESPTIDINTVGDEYELNHVNPHEYSDNCKTLEDRCDSSISDDPAIIELKKSPKADVIKASDILSASNDNSIYMSDEESDALELATTSNDSSGYKSLDNISLLGATAISPSKDSPTSNIPLSSSSGSSGISEFMDDAAFNSWMSLSADQRRENMVSNKMPRAHPSSPVGGARPSSPVGRRPPQARPSSPVGPLSSFPTSSLESTAAHNRLATLSELQGDGSIVPPGMSEEDALQKAIEESKKLMSVERARGRGDWRDNRDIVPKGLSEEELIKRALEESKKEALWTSISNPRVDLNYPTPLVQDSRKDSNPQTELSWPVKANTGAKPKKRSATPSLQPPTPVQRSSTPPSRPSWEETGARRKPRNGISKSPEPQGRRSNSNPGGSGYAAEGVVSGSGYTVEGMSEEEQLALALSQSRLEAPPSLGELRDVVVDGSNVGMHHGNHRVFSVKGISICVDYFTKLGHKVLVMMPRHRWNRASPQEKEVLDALEGSNVLKYTPARKTPTNSWTCYDDRFMVEYASQHGAVVLTNDNYRDLKDEPKYKDTIENRILPYMWANDTFMPSQDPMGRNGPKLDEFLRK